MLLLLLRITQVSVRLHVGMVCGGCEGAVRRILGKMEGVSDVITDIEGKLVTARVAAPATPADVEAALLKWGTASKKEVRLLEPASA